MMFTDDLIWEVLKRLPVKSLMRFKCVSRTWLSMITDPSFAKAYSGGTRGLISVYPWELESHSVFYLSLNGGSCCSNQIVFHHTVDHGGWEQMETCTDVVNGLLCFYRDRDSWLYNVATREMVQLPISSELEKSDDPPDSYHFGFDPVNQRYKLLRICSVRVQEKYTTCRMHVEILTIGVDSSWRIIGCLPHEGIEEGRSACLGGVLCWMNYCGDRIIAFHLAQEKFIHIPVPLEPGEVDIDFYKADMTLYLKLTNFGPDIVITKPANKAREESRDQILRYCLSDTVNGEETVGIWVDDLPEIQVIKPEITIPPDEKYVYEAHALGVLPNGKMLIYDLWQSFPITLYTFDPSMRIWELIQVDASRELPISRDIFATWSYFEENIISLARMTSCN
ncbi:OLC1v1022699C1 [Oldenlandia corymbosa var. corymbosa]|uniref:OLC1v1022699C1 n=1 Tax=Oldenlandia corymbosa var. corymbosa TaxID=529605 RepID=A0AAV1BYD8_OLDCO|nr:OLC1v1022699C1 [Oldenlandia corymbosa var. corymbosa]